MVQPLAAAIGGLVLAWGDVEASLTMCVALIFKDAGGRHHADKEEIPVALKRKLKFLRLCMRKIEALAPFKDDGLALLEIATPLAKFRNDVIHSFVSDADRQTMTFTFTALGSFKDKPLITGQVQYSVKQLVEIGGQMMEFGQHLVEFVARLQNALVPEDP
jgi:hypothetical protein